MTSNKPTPSIQNMSDNMEYALDQDLLALEAELASLAPQALSDEFIETISGEIDHSLIDAAVDLHDAELRDLEEHLNLLSPAGFSSDVLNRMTKAMDRWHEHVPVEEKVVPIGESVKIPQTETKARPSTSSYSSKYGAAAAVALLGAVSALMMPSWKKSDTPSVANTGNSAQENANIGAPIITTPVPALSTIDVMTEPRNSWIVPESLTHNVTQTRDAGVLVTQDNIPYRSIRIDYVDKVKVMDEDGHETEVNRPGVQYMLIPVQTN